MSSHKRAGYLVSMFGCLRDPHRILQLNPHGSPSVIWCYRRSGLISVTSPLIWSRQLLHRAAAGACYYRRWCHCTFSASIADANPRMPLTHLTFRHGAGSPSLHLQNIFFPYLFSIPWVKRLHSDTVSEICQTGLSIPKMQKMSPSNCFSSHSALVGTAAVCFHMIELRMLSGMTEAGAIGLLGT